jgi:hypothetical protein
MDRKAWDRIVSSAGAVLAVILLVLGGAAIYGGNFGQDNVRDRLTPQNDGASRGWPPEGG